LRKKKFILFIFAIIISSVVYLGASGLRSFELSARAAGLGGAFLNITDDASSIFYNPAALGFSSGIMFRTNLYYPKTTVTTESAALPTPAQSVHEVLRSTHFASISIKNRIAVGIGIFTPFSMETKWLENWIGRTFSIYSKLNTLYIRPAIAVKISNFLSVGAGIDFISSDVTWKYEKNFTFQGIGSENILVSTSESNVSSKATGFTAGILLKISDNLHIGGRYQPRVILDFKGAHTFFFPKSFDRPIYNIHQRATSSFTLPNEYAVGFMYSPGKSLTFLLDLQRTGMNEINKWEFDFNPQFYDLIEEYYGMRPDPIRDGIELNLKDTSSIMLGLEYRIKEFLLVRAGYSHQKSSVENRMIHPVFPDLDNNIISIGIGYDGPAFSIWDYSESIGGLSLDAVLQYGFSPDSSSSLPDFPVNYRASRWNIGLGIGFSFGSL